MITLPSVLILGLLLLFSAFFSASETALFSLTKLKIEKLKKRHRSARLVETLKKTPNHLLSTILIGNMFANVIFSSLMTYLAFEIWGDIGLTVAVISTSILLLIPGEILPKTYALYTAEKLSLVLVYPIYILMRVASPLAKGIIFISDTLFRFFFRRQPLRDDILTEEELKVVLETGKTDGVLEQEEKDMIYSTLEFRTTQVKEIMTPRIDMKALEITKSPEEIKRFLCEVKHTCVPVYENTVDNIVGTLQTKDFFLEKKPVRELLKSPLFVPENKKLITLFSEFYQKKEKIAIVIDEYGGTAGMVTLEDAQEEIFGEIYDEFEQTQESIKLINEKEYQVLGTTLIADINYQLGTTIPEETDTIAGFLLTLLDHFPKTNETAVYKNLELSVGKFTNRRIITVILRILKNE